MKTYWKIYLCNIVLAVAVFRIAETVTCYSCQNLPHPSDCGNVEECGQHEVCQTERVISPDGIIMFTSRCVDSKNCALLDLSTGFGKRQESTIACSECCNASYCNKNTCDNPKVETGIRCLECDDVLHPFDCKHVKLCSQDSQCFTQAFVINKELRYRLGCVPKSFCEAPPTPSSSPLISTTPIVTPFPIVGKRQDLVPTELFSMSCIRGCETENCNRELCGNGSTTGCQLKEIPFSSQCADVDVAACIIILSLAGNDGKEACTRPDIRNYLCRKTCGQCHSPIITQAPPIVTTPVLTTNSTGASTTVLTSTTTLGTTTIGPYTTPNVCGDYFPLSECHKVACLLDLCVDNELRQLCPNYCAGQCGNMSCSNIPGILSLK